MKNKTVRRRPAIGITIDSDIAQWLREEAEERRTTVSAIIQEHLLPLMEADQRGVGNVQQQARGKKIVQKGRSSGSKKL